jgi:nucleoside-diphosphate-sugar epimerase
MLPDRIDSVEVLEDLLSEPTESAIEAARGSTGDLVVLGAGGKMGPTLARMARRAADAAGVERAIVAVSRFGSSETRQRLDEAGVRTIECDLLDDAAVLGLPDATDVIYMAGMKFGATGQEALTWVENCVIPASVCRRYPSSRIVAFSTGNVYPLVAAGRASVEDDPPGPVGEYAMSCLGRERVFEHFSVTMLTPVTLLRLNYACELRYGVLVDLARRVWANEPIDVTTGSFNAIWQGDANAVALAAVECATAPPTVLNLTGPEELSVRTVSEELGRRMRREARFTGSEAGDALLSDASRVHALYGKPRVDGDRMIGWVADWIMRDGETLGKATKFEVRDGKF